MSEDRTEFSWLLDRARILELTAIYNKCFDSGDAEGFAATFTPDGVMDVVGGFRVEGTAGLEKMCRSTPDGVIHVTVDALIEVNGDEATQDVRVVVLGRALDGKTTPTLDRTGRYQDRLVRTSDGWRFAERRVALDGGI